jgi:hypothetical protein
MKKTKCELGEILEDSIERKKRNFYATVIITILNNKYMFSHLETKATKCINLKIE